MTSANISPEGLNPVRRSATERAYKRVIVGSVTDENKYRNYQRQVYSRHGGYWGAIQLVGSTQESARRLAGVEPQIQLHSYIGGALLYLASREEQARIDRRPLPPLLAGNAGQAAVAALTIDTVPPEQPRDLAVGIANEMPDVDLDRIANASLRNALAVNNEIIRQNRASFEASPFADDVTKTAHRAAKAIVASSATRVAAFPRQEGAFCNFMADRWWSHKGPAVTLTQITGAADARVMIAMSQ